MPNREPVDLEREVQALFDFYEVVADDADVKLVLSGEATVVGDRLMIQRAIGNLLSNLGLSITQSLMVAHGGTIRVRSDQKNTSFTLVFPA